MRQTRGQLTASILQGLSLALAHSVALAALLWTAPALAAGPQATDGARGSATDGEKASGTVRGLSVLLSPAAVDRAALDGSTPAGLAVEPQRRRRSDFTFGRPSGWIGLHGGWSVARAESDIFAFNTETLTLDSSDFNAPFIGFDVGWAITDRAEAIFGVEYSKTSPRSEFRDFVDEFGAPIVQTTSLQTTPLTASLRLNLVERGRSVGNFAWVPNSVTPYVGGGAGIVWWKYEQFGDFVDFVDFTIFTEHFASDGVAPTAHVFGGLEFNLSPRVGLGVEGRYTWAEGELAPAFVGFEPIDLSGLRGSVGVTFRF